MDGLIEFQTAGIADIGTQTMSQKAVWDEIWESTKTQIGATASQALDRATGVGLEERSARYHAKSTEYSLNVQQQGQAVNQIGSIATETNAAMVRAITRGG